MSDLDPMTSGNEDALDLLKPHKCHARSKQTGEQCGQWAPPGFYVCAWHGAKSPRAQEAAQKRLLNLVSPALDTLQRLVESDDPKAASTALAAAKDILDRAGLGATQKIEISDDPTAELRGYLARAAEELAEKERAGQSE